MNTPSHLIMTAALGRFLQRRRTVPLSAFLLGSVAPDLPLYGLSLVYGAWYRWHLGWSWSAVMAQLFDENYFHDLVWIGLHNCLHAPCLIGLGLWLSWRGQNNGQNNGCWWFFLACGLHSGIDMLTHADDGPLLFFPFDWHLRFDSPVSYWDPRHYGQIFAPLELGLDLVLLFWMGWEHKRQRRAVTPPSGL